MSRAENKWKKYTTVFIGMLLLVLAIGFGCRIYASAAVSGTITASTLFVRTGPSTEYAKAQVNGKSVFLSRGDSVAISYETNGWYYVTASFEGTKVNGYISATYVTPASAVPTAAPTTTPTVKPTATPKPTSSASSNEVATSGFPRQGTITAGVLNVRSNAGTSGSSVIGQLSKDAEVTLLGVKQVNQDYWYQISYTQGGVTRTGYVSSAYVKAGAAPTAVPTPTKTPDTTTTEEIVTSGFPRQGTITATALNVRSGAGKTNAVVGSVSNGASVTILDAVKDASGTYWYKIKFTKGTAEKEGYVSSTYVKAATATPSPTAVPTVTVSPTPTATPAVDSTASVVAKGEFPRFGTVTATSLNVRNGAGTAYAWTATIEQGMKVIVVSAQKDAGGDYWYQISFTRDSVKQTGYVHSKYIAVDVLTSVTITPVPTITVTTAPTPTPAVTLQGEAITQEDVDDFFAMYFYRGFVRNDNAAIYAETSESSSKLLILSQNIQLAVTGQAMQGEDVWYRVAVKNSGIMCYGYMQSKDVDLSVGMPITAQVISDGIRMKTKASNTGSYVKDNNSAILSLTVGNLVSIVSETYADGEKWFEIDMEKDGTTYRGFVLENTVFFLEFMSDTPWSGELVTPAPTKTPTLTPTVTPTKAPTKTPTPSPSPTATPIPTPVALPTPRLIELKSNEYPFNEAGTITGYGTTENEYGRSTVMYSMPVFPYSIVYDDNGYYIEITGTETLILYDKYIDSSNNVFRHVGLQIGGKTYYGYIDNTWIVEKEPEIPATPTPTPGAGDLEISAGGNMTGNQADFEYYMDQQGFPESYKPYLRALHEEYPNWVFEAYHTKLSWDDTIAAESVAGKNLIPNSKSAEWKSFETGAYDWTTAKHIVYDGSTWVTASKAAIEYYMDPRNFLNKSNIFMFEVLRYAPEYQNEKGVETILGNTPFQYSYYTFTDSNGIDSTMSYAQTFVAAAAYSGVSPYHLATRVKQEVVTSATTTSNSVTGTVSGLEGLYNFYNIGAYHSTAAGGAIANGLKYAKNGASNNDELNDASLIPWTNQYNAIVGGAYILGVNYINRGQDTIYLQKFNVTGTSTYYHQYMSNVEAPYSESKKTASAYADMGELPIVFSIPVYLNMPEEAVSAPEKAYDPNNWLKELVVYDGDGNDLQLTPTFNIKTNQVYYLVVEKEDAVVQIKATPVTSKATVTGSGFHALQTGANVITIKVQAENGDIREYLIFIVRQE